MSTTTTADLMTELQEAKEAVTWLLEHSSGSVDFHGLAYWAGRVEKLREQVREVI